MQVVPKWKMSYICRKFLEVQKDFHQSGSPLFNILQKKFSYLHENMFSFTIAVHEGIYIHVYMYIHVLYLHVHVNVGKSVLLNV